MLSLRRWQLVLLLLIGSALLVKCGKKEVKEEEHEEDGGEKDEEDHFGEEGHKGEKGSHKKVNQFNPEKMAYFVKKKHFDLIDTSVIWPHHKLQKLNIHLWINIKQGHHDEGKKGHYDKEHKEHDFEEVRLITFL